jgi:SAM-dependent methyltransferase
VINPTAQDSPPTRHAAALKQAARNFFYANRTLKYCWSKGHQFRCRIRQFVGATNSWLFDLWNGIDSSGYQSVDRLSIKGLHGHEATGYGPVDPETFRHALSSLGIDFSEYVFVDFGSGKGRAVLMASLYPFKKVIGVEFAKELHEVALKNARTWRPKPKCNCIQFFWADVLEFEIPQEPCVICFYHAFSEVVVRSVFEIILRSVQLRPRNIIVIYVNPEYEHAVPSLPNVVRISKTTQHTYRAYRIMPPPP